LCMPLVRKYCKVRKKNEEGTLKTFSPLRAVGLAVEVGHGYCKTHGFGRLSPASVSRVHVSGGSLQVKQGQRWRRVPSCDFELAPQEASFAVSVVRKHRAFFDDLGLNLWEADLRMPNRLGCYDLVGDFSVKKNFGVLGLVWVELKVFSGQGFAGKLQAQRTLLEEKLEQVNLANSSVEAVLLLAARADKVGRSWQAPTLAAQLLVADGSDWQTLAGRAPAKIPRGRAKWPLEDNRTLVSKTFRKFRKPYETLLHVLTHLTGIKVSTQVYIAHREVIKTLRPL